MKLIYAPKDGEREEWSFSEDDLTVGEVKLLEQVHEMPFGEIGDLAERGSMTILASLFWIMRRRNNPGMQLTDMDDIRLGDLSNEADEKAEGDVAPKDETTSTPEEEVSPTGD